MQTVLSGLNFAIRSVLTERSQNDFARTVQLNYRLLILHKRINENCFLLGGKPFPRFVCCSILGKWAKKDELTKESKKFNIH